jgi:hypothetical protein
MLRAKGIPALAALAALGLASCVVTTYEGPGEPPRVPAPPERPATAKHAATPASDDEGSYAEAPGHTEDTVGARHLLVQYKGSMRAGPGIVRTRDEALKRATEALTRAKAGEDFAALVREYSDEPGAAERGGDLGRFQRKQMVKEFANAAFALDIGAVSDVVETPFGFHVIQRTE